jgi:hypothetical protein
LNFEFLLVLNHDDVTWDYPEREDLGKRRKIFGHNFEEVWRVIGLSNRTLKCLARYACLLN